MELPSIMMQNALWVSAGCLIFFTLLLAVSIKKLLQTIRQARICSVPLIRQQEVEFIEKGNVVLCLEGPLLSNRFANLEYELIGPDGKTVQSRMALFRMRATSFNKLRMEVNVYKIVSPGRHMFFISGLGNGKNFDSEHQIVFTHPHLPKTILLVLGIVVSGCVIIGSLVLLLLSQ